MQQPYCEKLYAFLSDLQKNFPVCNRKNCGQRMIPVEVRYEDHGEINHEFECPHCGKVKKDPVLAEKRRQQYLERKKNTQNKYRKSNVPKK